MSTLDTRTTTIDPPVCGSKTTTRWYRDTPLIASVANINATTTSHLPFVTIHLCLLARVFGRRLAELELDGVSWDRQGVAAWRRDAAV
jgi:hypothetical protein